MMDELIKQILAQSPVAGVLLFALWIVYKDLKANQDKAAEEREFLINAILDIKSRAKTIEQATTGETSPTIMNRPERKTGT